jgi:hypothetical protein
MNFPIVLDSWSDGVEECLKFLHSKQEVTGPLSGELRAREPVSLIFGSGVEGDGARP